MQSFVLDRAVIGTRKHLYVRGNDQYGWVEEIPGDTWWVSGGEKNDSTWCLDSVLRLNDIEIDLKPQAQFINAVKLVTSEKTIPWVDVMPTRDHRSFVRRLVKSVADVDLDTSYYKDVWCPGNFVLNSLRRCKINNVELQSLLDEGVGNHHVLETFKPLQGGYAKQVVYNRFGTRTGRLTVESGPGILTLRRDYRNRILESRYGDDGRLMMIDFANLEPRVILYEAGRRCDNVDLYTTLNNELFGGQADRTMIKEVVIAELYGMSKESIQAKLGVEIGVVNEFVKAVKSYFETKKLLKMIKSGFLEVGHIKNRYGRKVRIDEPLNHIFVNSYAQSTGADVSLLGFSKIIKMFDEHKIVPLYVIMDALIVDVHKDELEFLKKIKKINVNGYVQSFFLKIEEL